MKKLFVLLSFTLLAGGISAQGNGYSFFGRLPGLPTDACSMTGEQRQNYMNSLNQLIDDMNDAMSKRRKQMKQDVENARPEIEKNMAKEYGLSNSDVQKLKNKKMSKTEKLEIANRMLQEKAGISMKEIQKLKGMSKEGKKAWAEGYTTQQQAKYTGNPDSNKTEEQVDFENKLANDKKTLDLVKERQLILNKINASDVKFARQMQDLIKKDSVETIKRDRATKPLFDKLNSASGLSEAEMIAIQREIRSFETTYCQALTPRFMEILQSAYVSLSTSLADYQKLEEINDKVNKTMLMTNKNFSSPGMMQIEAVSAYAHQLLNAFQYVQYSFPDPDEIKN